MKKTFHYASIARQITKEEYDNLLSTADLVTPIGSSEQKKKFPFCILHGDKFEIVKDGKRYILVHIESWRGKEQYGIRDYVTEVEIEENMNKQFAVFEKHPAHTGKSDSIILGMYATKEEAQAYAEKYGYNTDNYYVSDTKKYIDDMISRTKKIPYNDYASYTQIPESIAKQPLDPNADYSQSTELVDLALKLVKKVFDDIKNKQ